MKATLSLLLSLITSSVFATTTKPAPITINSQSPYYLVAKAVLGTQVMSGTDVNGCMVKSFTDCSGQNLNKQDIQGAFLAYSKLSDVKLEHANLMLGDIAFVSGRKINLSQASLSGITMNGADFRNAHLVGTIAINSANAFINLSNANLRHSNFQNASFVGAKLTNANFHGANLFNADLSGADLSNVKFDQADLSGVNFAGATNYKTASFKGAKLCNTVMPDGRLKNKSKTCRSNPGKLPSFNVVWYNPFYDAVKPGTPVTFGQKVDGCKLKPYSICNDLKIKHTNLYNANLSYAKLLKTNFSHSDVRDVNFNFTDAREANFSHANLIGTSFTGGNFQSANFEKAMMRLTSLSYANFSYANFSNADMAFTNLNHANFTGANLSKVDLASTDVNGVDFSNADMEGINLSDADLSGANLSGANLKDAIYCNTIMPNGSVKAPHKGLCPHQPL